MKTKNLVLTQYQAEVFLVDGSEEFCKPFDWMDESKVTDSIAYLQVGLKSFETFNGWDIPMTSVVKYRITQSNKMLCSVNAASDRVFYADEDILKFIRYAD